jgi:hypothetical protein
VVCAGGGGCSDECQPGQVHQPGTCRCCTTNGQPCGPSLPDCCAAIPGGSNQCSNGTCQGRADGASCTFNEQCASRFGCNGGQCGLAIGGP